MDARRTDARNRDFARYEQVDKPQDYRLAEALHRGAGEPREEFDEDFAVRTASLAADPQEFAADLGGALEEIGFCILVDHGIDPVLHQRSAAAVVEMVGRTPPADKMRYRPARHGSVNQGWFPMQETTEIHPDLVEGWVLCRRAFDLGEDPNFDPGAFWPEWSFEPIFRELCLAQQELILPIMAGILRYLGCDPHSFDQRLTGTNFGLRLNWYPPVPADAPPGAGRLLGHEDVDLFTLLPAPTVAGLQVLNRQNMKWVRLTAPPGSIILNTGDYMQRISNDRLPSTTHRVSRPQDPVLAKLERVSFPMNIYLWEDEILEVLPGLGPPRYPPVRAEDFHVMITSKYYGDDYGT